MNIGVESNTHEVLHRVDHQPGLFAANFKAFGPSSSLNYLGVPVQRLTYAERWLNGGSRTYSAISTYSEIQQKYQPTSEIDSFSVPLVKLPKKMVQIHSANPDTQLLAQYVDETTVNFPIHPQFYRNAQVPFMKEIVDNKEQESSIEVTPTSSTRSVIVLNEDQPTHCVKLHCPAQISRFNRKLDARDVAKSVNTSREFDRALKENPHFPKSFGFLPESLGITIGEGEEGWGFLLREMTPRPVADDAKERTLLPLFSLYSLDTKDTDPAKKVLLVELIERSNMDPKQFILEKVMLPIVESWCFLAKDLGILAQAHGQNLLLEVGKDNVPTRVIFRDLSTYMDRPAREKMGLSNEGFPLPRQTHDAEFAPMSPEQQKGYYSLVYDSFVGHHLFNYLAKAMKDNYGVEKAELQEACKKKFRECFPDADEHFPSEVHYYSKKCNDGFTQELENTGEKPDWR